MPSGEGKRGNQRTNQPTHFGKLISIGNKSLRTQQREGERGKSGDTSSEELRFESFQGKKGGRKEEAPGSSQGQHRAAPATAYI